MTTVELAYELIQKHSFELDKIKTPLSNALSCVLAEDITAPIHLPSFRNSAMDGYAIRMEDYKGEFSNFFIHQEIQAGLNKKVLLNENEAARIFTGAPVPENCNAVIIQEHAVREGDQVRFITPTPKDQQNIRQIGEQVKVADVALNAGVKLTPAALGYLASLGILEVIVFRQPKVALITTGDELIKPGNELQFGEIYESNSASLLNALKHMGISEPTHIQIKDNYNQTVKEINSAINEFDILLLTGGVSVGDYDFVGKAFKEIKVEELFYKVKQKPGGPLFFGRKGDTLLFGLPGNPAAALSCFYVYAAEAIRIMCGNKGSNMINAYYLAKNEYTKKGSKSQFLKGLLHNGEVEILEGQSSNMMHTFAIANCLVYMEAEATVVKPNEKVGVVLI
ncbi:MAG: molybdopterin molybdotransferase MoeA [Flavobacteriales bacterium]|nr:molybdopterin molybdotransferase MoeA [Flavobacteriales bacterium]